MKTQIQSIKEIAVADLLLDLMNPRYEKRPSQREAITTIIKDQDVKLVNLAEDILDKGLNPSKLSIVVFDEETKKYIVLEGNRRICALKILNSPNLLDSLDLPEKLVRKFKKLLGDRDGGEIPDTVACIVMNREDANHWIRLEHTGQNDGVGVLEWDASASHRFRGSSPALQAIELVRQARYLTEDENAQLPKIAITNIERLLGTPEARKLIGVELKNDQLTLGAAEEKTLGRLAIVVKEVLHKQIRVRDLDNKQQRIDYAKSLISKPLPKPNSGNLNHGALKKGGKTAAASRKLSVNRDTLIPKNFKIKVEPIRINRIYNELQKLTIARFTNSCAVLLRVFIEMSIDEYAAKHKIVLTEPEKAGAGVRLRNREMTLRKKIEKVAGELEKSGACSKDELRGVRTLISNRNHVISVDGWNAFVHNSQYNPSPDELKLNWDNIQTFVEKIWG